MSTAAAKLLEREQARAKREALELAMLQHLKSYHLTDGLLRNHRFHPTRKWAFDFAWPAQKVALEVDGGTFADGRHSQGHGYDHDCEKLNTATLAGWRVLRVTSTHLRDGMAIDWTRELLHGAGYVHG